MKNQLDFFLINNLSNVINRSEVNELNRSFSSDHKVRKIILQLTHENILRCKRQKYAFNKLGWNKLNAIISENPFIPYCYSNVEAAVKQWYKWLENLLAKDVPRPTNHRASLPPWVKKETSHLMKSIATLKRKTSKKSSLAKRLKLKKKENQVRKNLVEDQAEFEKKVLRKKIFRSTKIFAIPR